MDPANNNGSGDKNIDNGNGNQDPQGQPPAGNDPANSEGGTGKNGFDPTTLDDDAFSKIFTDPRLFNHPRFKSLNERAKEADELRKKQEDADKKAMEDQGKFKELADAAEARATAAEQRVKDLAINNAVQSEAIKLGVVDPVAAAKLLDQSSITVSDDGTVNGVAEAVKSLAEKSPYLFKTPAGQSVGAGTNPDGGGDTPAEFTGTQISDLAFYRKNAAAIDKAIAEGRVDMSK